MHLKFFLPVFTLFLLSCGKAEDHPNVQIDIRWPFVGLVVEGDTLNFDIALRTTSAGMMKLSLVNEKGVSIIGPKIFEEFTGDSIISGYFLIDNLDYIGNASLVALWSAGGYQKKKSVRVMLARVKEYSDAFILFRSYPADFRLMHLLANGNVSVDVQNGTFHAIDAVWSAPSQTLLLLHPDRRSVIALNYPYSNIQYTLYALSSPNEFVWVRADGNRFWLGERGGIVRAVRAADGHPLITINGSPDSLPYAINHSSQFSAVSYLSGANKHTIKIYYRNTGSLHSVWPLTGRVVDAAWKNENQINIAVRKASGIELYEVSVDPPMLKYLDSFSANQNDSLLFVPGEAFLVRSGLSITKYRLGGQMLWQKEFPGFPRYIALKSNDYWVRYLGIFQEISADGQHGQVVVLPENPFSGYYYSAIFAPVRK